MASIERILADLVAPQYGFDSYNVESRLAMAVYTWSMVMHFLKRFGYSVEGCKMLRKALIGSQISACRCRSR